jgi:carbon starvation protein
MSAAFAVFLALILYALAYRFYGGFLSKRIFDLDPNRVTPAIALNDGVDFVPTNRYVLFGHHWASITGLSPMLGPAIAVIWGWGPAMPWVVLGALLIGCVHDMGALVVSIRSKGESVGKVAEEVIGKRAKMLFLAIFFFGIALAMGVFTIALSGLFSDKFGSAVIPSGGLMILAGAMGFLIHRKGYRLGPLTLIGFLLLLGLMFLGYSYPVEWKSQVGWKSTLLFYGFLASVLPVWSLLQPRDFLNSLLLYLGLAIAFLGFFIMSPEFGAPMVQIHPKGAPPIFPFVFITIACGAASGFHGLVASGTTAKQLTRETDARFIAYGGMIGESLLALLAVLATAAGFVHGGDSSPAALWQEHYSEWASTDTTKALHHFIDGTARFVAELGISVHLAAAFVAVLVVSFALTTLDSATRLLRYNVSEIGDALRIPPLKNRYVASTVAVGAIGFFSFYKVSGQPMGSVLWGLFGTTNQLLAALALLTVTLYLLKKGRSPWYTGIPAVFMMMTTVVAMVENLGTFSAGFTFEDGTVWPLFIVGSVLFALAIWLSIEVIISIVRVLKLRQRAVEA